MSYQRQGSYREECLGKECAWADKKGKCLIAKALRQITDPLSCLAQGYPAVDQNILHNQPTYITHLVHQDAAVEIDKGWGGF
jgi:hypothetical protein